MSKDVNLNSENKMKRIEAIVRVEKLDAIKNALADAGYVGMTTYEVRGRGRQRGYPRFYRGREVRYDLLPKLKIELVVNDNDVESTTTIIKKHAFTGDIGDGKIFIYPIEDVIRIRTGESGEDAIGSMKADGK